MLNRRQFIGTAAAGAMLHAARRRYVKSIGIPDASVVELEYLDYARSKYLALGMPDTMP